MVPFHIDTGFKAGFGAHDAPATAADIVPERPDNGFAPSILRLRERKAALLSNRGVGRAQGPRSNALVCPG
jgi:hypothetical protein